MAVSEKGTVRFGPFEFDPQCGELRKDGSHLKLQGQPIEILELLLAKHGELVSREEIRQHLWSDDTFVDFEHSLNTAIKKLRQALGDEAVEPRYIETLPKRGYRFVGQVEEPLAKSATAADPVESLPEIQLLPKIEGGRELRVRLSAVTVVALTVLATMVLVHYLRPPEMPSVVATHRLTNSGYMKYGLATDGRVLYFQETRPMGTVAMQMNLNGGESSEISGFLQGAFRGVSPDKSKLLVGVTDPKTGIHEVWSQPLPAGFARLIVKDARWPVWTSDGSGVLFSRNNDNDLYRVNADGTDVRHLARIVDISGISVSPDGRRIRVVGSRAQLTRSNLNLWELTTNGSNPHLIGLDSMSAGRWSPDGRFYFFWLFDGEKPNLWVAPGEKKWWWRNSPKPKQLTFGPLHIGSPTPWSSPVEFSDDGKRLFVIGTEPRGELSAYDEKSRSWAPYMSGISACYADFSRDGQWVAYVSYPEGNLWRSRIDGSERMQLTSPPTAVLNPRWSPDGKLIAFTNIGAGDGKRIGERAQIYVVSRDGGGPLLLPTVDVPVGDATWSPDGSALAYDAGNQNRAAEIRVLNLKTQRSEKLNGSDGLWSPRWSPDGKYLVTLKGAPNSFLVLFTIATGRQEELAPEGDAGWPSWSRDSKSVYFWSGTKFLRIDIASHAQKEIADLRIFPNTSYFFESNGWFGITPDGRPLSTRNTAKYEIYAFDLEYK